MNTTAPITTNPKADRAKLNTSSASFFENGLSGVTNNGEVAGRICAVPRIQAPLD